MLETLNDKISHSSTGAGSDVITIPKVAVRRIIISGTYTVTDASVSANEDIDGYIDTIEISADGKIIFKVNRNELKNVCKLLAPYGVDSVEDSDAMDMVSGAALYYDGLPTTAEEQRYWFVLNLSHDFRMYETVEMKIAWRAATDEWGTASAFVFKAAVSIQHGNVPRSLGIFRVPGSSSTEHSLSMGEYPVIAGLIVPTTVEYITTVRIKGKDGTYDVDINEPTAGAAMYYAMTGATPGSDSVAGILLPDMLIPYFQDRLLTISASTATAVACHFVTLLADGKPKATAVKGDVKRGVAPATLRQFTPGAAARAVTGLPSLVRPGIFG
jgi:hypothetical protein